jgi:hypothetical protein
MSVKAAIAAAQLVAAGALADRGCRPPEVGPPVIEAPRPSPLRLAADAGYGLLFFDGLRAHGAHARLGIGRAWEHFALFPQLALFAGRTEQGLPTTRFQGGLAVEGTFGRFRFGGGPQIGGLWIERVTRHADPMSAFLAGVWLFLALDAVRWDRSALFVQVTGNIDVAIGGPPVQGLALTVGVRLRPEPRGGFRHRPRAWRWDLAVPAPVP